MSNELDKNALDALNKEQFTEQASKVLHHEDSTDSSLARALDVENANDLDDDILHDHDKEVEQMYKEIIE